MAFIYDIASKLRMVPNPVPVFHASLVLGWSLTILSNCDAKCDVQTIAVLDHRERTTSLHVLVVILAFQTHGQDMSRPSCSSRSTSKESTGLCKPFKAMQVKAMLKPFFAPLVTLRRHFVCFFALRRNSVFIHPTRPSRHLPHSATVSNYGKCKAGKLKIR